MKIVEGDQRSVDWSKLHIGRVSASEAKNILTPQFKTRDGEMPRTYLFKKAAELYKGYPLFANSVSAFELEQGVVLEEEALPMAAMELDLDLRGVSFCISDDDKSGCSPDALVAGRDLGLECKCPGAAMHVKYLLDDELPEEYRCQVHFCLYVTGYPEWVFFSYRRGFPPFVKWVKRDEEIIEKIDSAVQSFNAKLTDAVQQLRNL